MVSNDLLSNNNFKGCVKEYGGFIYRCYYDYEEKCYCSCIECVDCLKNECKILFKKFNIILGNYYNYDEDLTDRTPILVEMELVSGDYIKKFVPASYIIKMLK